jgi:hypothetical protein
MPQEISTDISSSGMGSTIALMIMAMAFGIFLFLYCVKWSLDRCEDSVRTTSNIKFDDKFLPKPSQKLKSN